MEANYEVWLKEHPVKTGSLEPGERYGFNAAVSADRLAAAVGGEAQPLPDGALVVYTRSTEDGTSQLMLQTSAAVLAARADRTVAETVRSDARMVARWSPDRIRSGRQRSVVMLIPAAGGAARELGECIGGEAHAIAGFPTAGCWSVPAVRKMRRRRLSANRCTGCRRRRLYVADRLHENAGRRGHVPGCIAGRSVDCVPAQRLGGRSVAYSGPRRPQRLTDLRTNIYGLAWAPDSRSLLFSRYINETTVLSTLALGSGRIVNHVGGTFSLMYRRFRRATARGVRGRRNPPARAARVGCGRCRRDVRFAPALRQHRVESAALGRPGWTAGDVLFQPHRRQSSVVAGPDPARNPAVVRWVHPDRAGIR